MLQDAGDLIGGVDEGPATEEARRICVLNWELDRGAQGTCIGNIRFVDLESTYTLLCGISDTPWRYSFHFGSTIGQRYGRPCDSGLKNFEIDGNSYSNAGRHRSACRISKP